MIKLVNKQQIDLCLQTHFKLKSQYLCVLGSLLLICDIYNVINIMLYYHKTIINSNTSLMVKQEINTYFYIKNNNSTYE